jgi:L-lactate dehydrogenase
MGKVSIIGAGGRVGSTAAFVLQLGGIAQQLNLIDVVEGNVLDVVRGEALDLVHGYAFAGGGKVDAGGYELLDGSNVVVICSGLRRRPDESRLDLIGRNVAMFRGIVGEVKNRKLAPDAVVLVVSNPVDILTYLAAKELGITHDRVIGLGTVLDTCRFRSLLAAHFNVMPTDVNALLLGEHGDSMMCVWSTATIGGVPLKSFPTYDEATMQAIFERARSSGAEVIRLKGGAGQAVGVSIAEVVHAVLQNKRQVLPVSSVQTGLFGIKDVALSVPTVVGRNGVEGLVEIALTDDERAKLVASGDKLRAELGQAMSAG